MPFDALSRPGLEPATDAEALFRRRRAEAAAAVLLAAPPERFDLDTYGEKRPCGTVACFIGWMAEIGHDGWGWARSRTGGPLVGCPALKWGGDPVPSSPSAVPCHAAADYFGLDHKRVREVFGNGAEAQAHYGKPPRDVTAAEVAAALLASPVVPPEDEAAT